MEKRDGKVFVTLGAGGAFQSGSAELTPDAKALIAKLSKDAIDQNSSLTITGHTDNVPIANFKYSDNWELALPGRPVSQDLFKTPASLGETE